jgi:hypothetical protein
MDRMMEGKGRSELPQIGVAKESLKTGVGKPVRGRGGDSVFNNTVVGFDG